jgi:hypothetical protein
MLRHAFGLRWLESFDLDHAVDVTTRQGLYPAPDGSGLGAA